MIQETRITKNEKETRLIQMREAQKKLKQKRKNEIHELQDEIESLKAEKDQLSKELIQYKRDFNSIYGLFDVDITGKQFLTLTSITSYKFEPAHDAYIPLATLTEDRDYNRQRNLFDTNNKFMLQIICEKDIQCVTRSLEDSMVHNLYKNSYKFIPKYGIALIGNFVRDIRKITYESLVPKCWFYERDQMDLPKHVLTISEIIDEVSKKFDHSTMVYEVLLALICRYSFITDYGLVIYPEPLERSFKLCVTSNLDELYVLGSIEKTLCLDDLLRKLDTTKPDENKP